MPRRAGSPCRVAGCAGVVPGGEAACTAGHGQSRPTVDGRESASRRGYDARWRRLRVMFLRRHPLCADPFQVHGGSPVPATDVDHVQPLRDGGSNRIDNLQQLCHSCHSRKTAEDVGRRRGRGVQISGAWPTETERAGKFSRPRVLTAGGGGDGS